MFNFFLRPYLPGFRAKAQDDVPGFNIGENDGAPLETGTRPYLDEGQTQTPPIATSFTLGSDGLTQSAPPIGFAGIRVEPQDGVPGFNLNEAEFRANGCPGSMGCARVRQPRSIRTPSNRRRSREM
jgi:hypothetical protein